MLTCVGFVLLFGVIGGGLYLYYKVERLDREIARQTGRGVVEGDDEKS